eukprot:TRINITY_DN67245_c0_g1_i1.p1 TRINITY_DN67245_c0_g1~~TRINITY_DN67245_c0_g1_i1.p1  ORF type:complete len:202 (+),score=18.85 TRINITY_DN67245_c0_g1_i1:112-717(+)
MVVLRLRRLHNSLSVLVTIPILVSAITGAIWAIEKHWIGKKPATWLMKWHQGDQYFGLLAPSNETFLVDDGSGPLPQLPLTRHWRYPYFWALGLAAGLHFASGVAMLKLSKRPLTLRSAHHFVALVLSWPIILTVLTGVVYRILRMHGFEQVKWIRVLHAGYFSALMPYYPLLVSFALIFLSVTGLFMYFRPYVKKLTKSS